MFVIGKDGKIAYAEPRFNALAQDGYDKLTAAIKSAKGESDATLRAREARAGAASLAARSRVGPGAGVGAEPAVAQRRS